MDAVFKISVDYEVQRKGESIHSPETCLPGAGWEFKNAGSMTLPIQTRRGEAMTVNWAFMEQGAAKQLSYFWFPQHDTRCFPQAKRSSSPPKLQRRSALFKAEWPLFEQSDPLYPNEDVVQAEQRLAGFSQAIVRLLNEHLPK